jgi:ORF6N domain-containing protein
MNAAQVRQSVLSSERIERAILLIRGHKVMLDAYLAELYGVETKVLNQAVRRNRPRFPADFMFQLTGEESERLRCQIGTSSLRSQIATSKAGRGGRRYLPYAFTEQGVAMLSSVLRSERAVRVNIEIMRAFVKLRELLAGHKDLARKLAALEQKYDAQFKVGCHSPANGATGSEDEADRVSSIKTTRYFEEQVMRKRPYIQRNWCEQALQQLARREAQADGRVRYWAFIDELGKHLRVVTLADGETVLNAFRDVKTRAASLRTPPTARNHVF